MVLHTKELIYSYLAGFIDADGSITIIKTRWKDNDKSREQYRVKLAAHNCKLEPIELLQKEFGGGKLRNTRRGKVKLHANWRPCYEWVITNEMAINAIIKMLPYLKVKKRQALATLKLNKVKKMFSPTKRRWDRNLNDRIVTIFETLKTRCNTMNKRGNL